MSLFLGALCACQLAAASPPNAPPQPALTAAALVARARNSRYQQDTTLSDYVTVARQRWSAGIGLAPPRGLAPLGRLRLAARFESVARIGWHHRQGAWAELLAARAVAPIAGETEPEGADDDIIFVIPYAPGRDRLWPMSEMVDAFPRESGPWIRHPLEAGSDSLYHFSLGGPLDITLPGGRQIHLRELLVRPVRPDDRLIVGSLWLDVANGALVRAAYRPSIPVDLWPYMEPNFDDDDTEIMRRFGPFRGNIEEIVIEHGLYDGRFWLPRARIAHAEGTAKGGRITISIEQTFDYERVNALAPGVAQANEPDSIPDDGDRHRDDRYYRDWTDRNGNRRPCREFGDSANPHFSTDSLPTLARAHVRIANGVRMRVLFPCERDDLLRSPLLKGSIYGESEDLFTEVDLGRLREETQQALAISSQAAWSPQRPTIRYGIDDGLLRYNRIEALSAGVLVERELGKGYSFDAMARLGVADLEPNGELTLRRRNGHTEYRTAIYRRLDVANDWGAPLGLSASLGSLLLGRDDWMYHRALGVEFGGTHRRIAGGPAVSWRLFAERHNTADVGTNFAFANNLVGTDFQSNVDATAGDYAGAAAMIAFAHGADPAGSQLSGHLKADGAAGELSYGRASAELRYARNVGRGATGVLTGAAGTSTGTLPAQRGFYLGGAPTLHADRVGALAGDAFWLARGELTRGWPLVRPVIFADWGWAGSRDAFLRTNGSAHRWSLGFGAAMFDGLVRFDVSRAMEAPRRWGVDVFVDVR
jgi:hypothetical protein